MLSVMHWIILHIFVYLFPLFCTAWTLLHCCHLYSFVNSNVFNNNKKSTVQFIWWYFLTESLIFNLLQLELNITWQSCRTDINLHYQRSCEGFCPQSRLSIISLLIDRLADDRPFICHEPRLTAHWSAETFHIYSLSSYNLVWNIAIVWDMFLLNMLK